MNITFRKFAPAVMAMVLFTILVFLLLSGGWGSFGEGISLFNAIACSLVLQVGSTLFAHAICRFVYTGRAVDKENLPFGHWRVRARFHGSDSGWNFYDRNYFFAVVENLSSAPDARPEERVFLAKCWGHDFEEEFRVEADEHSS